MGRLNCRAVRLSEGHSSVLPETPSRPTPPGHLVRSGQVAAGSRHFVTHRWTLHHACKIASLNLAVRAARQVVGSNSVSERAELLSADLIKKIQNTHAGRQNVQFRTCLLKSENRRKLWQHRS